MHRQLKSTKFWFSTRSLTIGLKIILTVTEATLPYWPSVTARSQCKSLEILMDTTSAISSHSSIQLTTPMDGQYSTPQSTQLEPQSECSQLQWAQSLLTQQWLQHSRLLLTGHNSQAVLILAILQYYLITSNGTLALMEQHGWIWLGTQSNHSPLCSQFKLVFKVANCIHSEYELVTSTDLVHSPILSSSRQHNTLRLWQVHRFKFKTKASTFRSNGSILTTTWTT